VVAEVLFIKLRALVALVGAGQALLTTIAEPQEQQTEVAVVAVVILLVALVDQVLSLFVMKIPTLLPHQLQVHQQLQWLAAIVFTNGLLQVQ
jgi:hypothetical protein